MSVSFVLGVFVVIWIAIQFFFGGMYEVELTHPSGAAPDKQYLPRGAAYKEFEDVVSSADGWCARGVGTITLSRLIPPESEASLPYKDWEPVIEKSAPLCVADADEDHQDLSPERP